MKFLFLNVLRNYSGFYVLAAVFTATVDNVSVVILIKIAVEAAKAAAKRLILIKREWHVAAADCNYL